MKNCTFTDLHNDEFGLENIKLINKIKETN